MFVQVAPPSRVRKRWPGAPVDPLQPEKVTSARLPLRGSVVTQLAARAGSSAEPGSGFFVASVQAPPSLLVTQTLPLRVVAQIVPDAPPSGAEWTFWM